MPGSAGSLNTCLGKYRGGPSGGHVRVTYDAKAGGVVKGEYHGKSGGAAGFEGKMVDKGRKVLGFWCVGPCAWVQGEGAATGRGGSSLNTHSPAPYSPSSPRRYDYDQKITPGNRFECTCVITLEGAHGEVLKAKLRTRDGGSDEWEAKRWSEQDVARKEGKIAGFCVKDAKTFERVTGDGRAEKEAWVAGARAKALEASVQRANFDGALTYIPGPATGAEYMTAHDLERAARVKEAGHRDERIAALEANVARLAARAAKGEDVKAQLDKAQQLHKGEVREKKMLEERADKKWVSGGGAFTPASSRHAEHMPDVYATELEVMRRLRKEDLERPEKDRARMAAELPRLQAAIGKGEGNVEALKRREEFLKRMLAAKIPAKDDFKEFKPTSRVVALASRCAAPPRAPPPCARAPPAPRLSRTHFSHPT